MNALRIFLGIFLISCFIIGAAPRNVTFDSRALIIDGKRRILVSGSIHYPRSTPSMWPVILRKMAEAGIDVVEMYDFWNEHEAVRKQYNFEGRLNIVQFMKEAQKAGLYVLLRIGPYVNAEWNYGGLPVWLKFENNIVFRTYNKPFMDRLEEWVTYLVNYLKENKMFYEQGGPIITAQIENEYGHHESLYGEDGKKYVKWLVALAKSYNLSIPWMMCAQDDAPADILNTCNGFYCDSWIPEHRQKFPNQPHWHTENWQGWFQKWGEPKPTRPAEDVAFSALRFYAKGGSLVNYYMFHGGNSYGRQGGSQVDPLVTSYFFDSLLDEFMVASNRKYYHLAALNKALKKGESVMLSQAEPSFLQIADKIEAHWYGDAEKGNCIAFLSNLGISVNKTVTFKGKQFKVPAWSVSILKDCSEEVYNSAKVSAQTPDIEYRELEQKDTIPAAGYRVEPIASASEPEIYKSPREQILTTQQKTDYLWYTTNFKSNEDKTCTLEFEKIADRAHVFVNGSFAGTTTSELKLKITKGITTLDILSLSMGLTSYGNYLEKIKRGILGDITLCQTSIQNNTWKHVTGVKGEVEKWYAPEVYEKLEWDTKIEDTLGKPLVWIIKKFELNELSNSIGLDMGTMGKGFIWVNGNNIGRYYTIIAKGKCEVCDYRGSYDPNAKCRADCDVPSQRYYHISPDFLKKGENVIVFFEETGGDIRGVKLIEKKAL